LKLTAQPLKSGFGSLKMMEQGKVPSLSMSVADCVTPLDVPGRPSMSGSLAARFSVTARLLVAAAPPLIWTVPLGGVASTRVVPLAWAVLTEPRTQVPAFSQAATVIS
jgi:hypothetical protein